MGIHHRYREPIERLCELSDLSIALFAVGPWGNDFGEDPPRADHSRAPTKVDRRRMTEARL